VPDIIPPPEIPHPVRVSRALVTRNELVNNYSKEELTSEINRILKAFDDAEQRTRSLAQIKTTPTTFTLSIPIGEGQIIVSLNTSPTADHGVWVYGPSYYGKVYELSQKLGLEAKTSEKPFAKIIIFNSTHGIRQISKVIEELVLGLIQIAEKSQ